MFRLSVILLLLSASHHARAQDTLRHRPKNEKYIGILLSANIGHYTYAELGVARIATQWSAREASSIAIAASSEIRIQSGKTIIGPKIGAWLCGSSRIVAMGANAIYYTDFNTGSFVLRPEVGIGFGGIKAIYGYNWQVVNNSFGGINSHLFSITTCIPTKKLKSS